MAKEMAGSETREIMRSAITLNPYNPKRHPEEAVRLQQRNFKKVGYLGGVSWNERTGHLLDGHRRVLAMDAIHKYDGTEATDYPIKVEAVNMDEKTEKEQMTYMAVGNTKADLDLVAEYIRDIDTKDIGLTDVEISSLLKFSEVGDAAVSAATEPAEAVETFFDFIPTPTVQSEAQKNMPPEEKIAHVKAIKEEQREDAERYSQSANLYVTLSFETEEAKIAFCEMLGVESDGKFVSGEEVLGLIS